MAPGRVARWYEMHLLDELGQRPEVDRCVECDRVLEAEERFRWVPPLGGVLCERCPGTAARPDGHLARGAQAAEGVPAPRHRGDRRAAPGAERRARDRGRPARVRARRARARRALARVPRRGPDAASRSGVGRRDAPAGSRSRSASRGGGRRRALAAKAGGGPMVGRTEGRLCVTSGRPVSWRRTGRARSTSACGSRTSTPTRSSGAVTCSTRRLAATSTSRGSSRAMSRSRSSRPRRSPRATSTSSGTTTAATTSSCWRSPSAGPPRRGGACCRARSTWRLVP